MRFVSKRHMIGFVAGALLVFSCAGLVYSFGGKPAPETAPAPHAAIHPPVAGGPRHISKDPRPNCGCQYSLPTGEDPTAIGYGPKADAADEDVADWGHGSLHIPDAWKRATGKGVKVAVLDTGANHDHDDLKNQILTSKDFTGSRSGDVDVHGHSSHCCGIIAAEKNGVGMVGAAPSAKLIVGKVLGDRGSGSNAGIAAGIDWAVDQGADVISMSLGGPDPDELTHAAVKRAVGKGVIVVCAAGNEGPGDETVGYPGGYPEVVCVAAVDKASKVARFSSRGAAVLVAAPGVDIRSCYPGNRYATMSGTSMATPYIAATAALYVEWARANNVKPTCEDFKARIKGAALDLDPAGRDNASGYGLLHADKLWPAGGNPNPMPPPVGDLIEWNDPGIVIGGRKVKRIVIELETAAPVPEMPVLRGLFPFQK